MRILGQKLCWGTCSSSFVFAPSNSCVRLSVQAVERKLYSEDSQSRNVGWSDW